MLNLTCNLVISKGISCGQFECLKRSLNVHLSALILARFQLLRQILTKHLPCSCRFRVWFRFRFPSPSAAPAPFAYLKLQISQYRIESKQRQRQRRKAKGAAAGEQLACTWAGNQFRVWVSSCLSFESPQCSWNVNFHLRYKKYEQLLKGRTWEI